ncbi:MAG: HNH endonuclease [Ardenticatenaceae bacterium]|nr:HNH endonuclease [Ardenticatenaceae bacterium]
MARVHIPDTIRQQIAEEAKHRCGYCLTIQEYTAMPMHIEHIIPIDAGGETIADNLWLACPLCNGHKATKIEGIDSLTGQIVPLFNPRHQQWIEHFRWSADGSEIIGQTAIGRATVIALQLNNDHFVRARRRWVLAGWHPPNI